MKITLCMIVLNEEECIERSLNSIIPYVDDAVIIDGGSTDNTLEILSRFNVKIIHNAWADNYSIQRNLSLTFAESEWIFVLDADEYVLPYVGENLRNLINTDYDSFTFIYKNFLDGKLTNLLWYDSHIKLFRNYCKFEGRYHEQLTGYKNLGTSNLDIYHDKKLVWQQKDNEHYWDLGQLPPPGWVKECGVWIRME